MAPATSAPSTGLTDNVAGLLAYVTIIPAIIFLVIEPYNRNRFVRFPGSEVYCTAGRRVIRGCYGRVVGRCKID